MSIPLDLGLWRVRNGQRRLLSWTADNGWLTLDGDLIAVVADEDDLRRRLDGWEFHCDLPGGLGWLAEQLNGCR